MFFLQPECRAQRLMHNNWLFYRKPAMLSRFIEKMPGLLRSTSFGENDAT
jgi:hypothetical protein